MQNACLESLCKLLLASETLACQLEPTRFLKRRHLTQQWQLAVLSTQYSVSQNEISQSFLQIFYRYIPLNYGIL